MPFITLPTTFKGHQITFDDILNCSNKIFYNSCENNRGNTKTTYREKVPPKFIEDHDIRNMLRLIKSFNQAHQKLIEVEDKSTLYHSFCVPKRSGGLRKIDAPLPDLCHALRQLKSLFETNLMATHHTAAFAYIKGRCTVDAIKRHQANKSRWFLKLDFSNFFGSTTLDFVIRQMGMIFPYSEIMKLDGGTEELTKAVSLGFLNGGLPQGTPLSPTITNIMMIPIDYTIAKEMRGWTSRIVYTRYADDLLLSSQFSFKWTDVQNKITEILRRTQAPFTIKTEKTRYGSSAGRNWNLGVMLNKDNQITVGNQKKKIFKATLFSLHNDYKNGIQWSLEDLQQTQGLISYYLMVERNNIQKIIDTYDTKFNQKVADIIKQMMKKAA